MIDILQQHIEKTPLHHEKIHLLREYLQNLILRLLYEVNAFKYISFTGGTALRILHGTARYSEDLDFSLRKSKEFDFDSITQKVKAKLLSYTLDTELKKSDKIVKSVEFRIGGILYALKLSPHKSEKLMIKIEVDTNPPAGAVEETHLISEPFLFTLRSYDLRSIFSGKLHAILFRKYIKGRDYYDLLWFLTKTIHPNLVLFKNAVYQTENIEIDPATWDTLILNKLKELDLHYVKNDVEPFLKNPEDSNLITLENLTGLLSKY